MLILAIEMGVCWALGIISVITMMSGGPSPIIINKSSHLFKNWSAFVYNTLKFCFGLVVLALFRVVSSVGSQSCVWVTTTWAGAMAAWGGSCASAGVT